jgi:hypothetical protein
MAATALCLLRHAMYSAPMSRALLLPLLLLAACATGEPRAEPTVEERRLLAYLARDPYLVIDSTSRDADGNLLVVTRQGRTIQRYLIAPDDPAKPALRLRRLEDRSALETVANPDPGGGPLPRSR